MSLCLLNGGPLATGGVPGMSPSTNTDYIYTKLIDILQLTLMKLMHVRIKFCKIILTLYYDNSI